MTVCFVSSPTVFAIIFLQLGSGIVILQQTYFCFLAGCFSIFSLFVILCVFLDFLPLICIFDTRVLVIIVLNLHRNFVVELCNDNIYVIPWAWVTFLWSNVFFDFLFCTLKSLLQRYFTYLTRSMPKYLHIHQIYYVWDIYFMFSLWDWIVSGYM